MHELILTRQLSVSQKTSTDVGAAPYGVGFNYRLQASFRGDVDESKASKALARVLSSIDHFSLGLDKELGLEPTTAAICAWTFNQIKALVPEACGLTLQRGDGVTAEIGYGQP